VIDARVKEQERAARAMVVRCIVLVGVLRFRGFEVWMGCCLEWIDRSLCDYCHEKLVDCSWIRCVDELVLEAVIW
jgi:hypothetical protein